MKKPETIGLGPHLPYQPHASDGEKYQDYDGTPPKPASSQTVIHHGVHALRASQTLIRGRLLAEVLRLGSSSNSVGQPRHPCLPCTTYLPEFSYLTDIIVLLAPLMLLLGLVRLDQHIDDTDRGCP